MQENLHFANKRQRLMSSLHVLASGTLFGLLSTGVMSFLEYLGAPCSYRRQMVLLSLVFVCWSVSVDVQLLNALDVHEYVSSNPPLYMSMEACITVVGIFIGSGLLFYVLQVYGSHGPLQPLWVAILLMLCCFVVRALVLVLLCTCPILSASDAAQRRQHDDSSMGTEDTQSGQYSIVQLCKVRFTLLFHVA